MVALKGACRNYDALWYCLARCQDVGSDYNIFFFCSVLYDHEHKTVAVCVHTHSSCCASWESCCPNDAMQDHGAAVVLAQLTAASTMGCTFAWKAAMSVPDANTMLMPCLRFRWS